MGEEYFWNSLKEKKRGFQGLTISIKIRGSAVTKVPIFKTSAGESRWLLMAAKERTWREEGARDSHEDPQEPPSTAQSPAAASQGKPSVVNTVTQAVFSCSLKASSLLFPIPLQTVTSSSSGSFAMRRS